MYVTEGAYIQVGMGGHVHEEPARFGPHKNASKTEKWPLYSQFQSKLSEIFRNGVIRTYGQRN